MRRLLARDDGTRVTVLDLLTYAGNRANLAAVEADPGAGRAPRRSSSGDIADPDIVGPLVAEADAVVNVAAETHVDRSILDPEAFLRTGVIGVHVLLEAVRREAARAATGERPAAPASSRSAPTRSTATSPRAGPSRPTRSRRAARTPRRRRRRELLVRAYRVTYGIDTVVTRGSNTYGPHQHPEKLIPLFVTNALAGEPLPMYGDGLQIRDWLHVSDHASGIEFVLRHGEPGETYNLPGGTELPNREVIARLLAAAGRDWSLVRTVPDRPGHDRRYAMDGSKLHALGWSPAVPFERGLPGDRRLVPRQPGVGRGGEGRRLGVLLRRASTRAGWPGAPPRTSRRSRRADPCGSPSPAPAAGSAGR